MIGLLRTIAREIVALFIDDALLAAGIVGLVALLGVAGCGDASAPWAALALFGGLAALLLLSVWRRARK